MVMLITQNGYSIKNMMFDDPFEAIIAIERSSQGGLVFEKSNVFHTYIDLKSYIDNCGEISKNVDVISMIDGVLHITYEESELVVTNCGEYHVAKRLYDKFKKVFDNIDTITIDLSGVSIIAEKDGIKFEMEYDVLRPDNIEPPMINLPENMVKPYIIKYQGGDQGDAEIEYGYLAKGITIFFKTLQKDVNEIKKQIEKIESLGNNLLVSEYHVDTGFIKVDFDEITMYGRVVGDFIYVDTIEVEDTPSTISLFMGIDRIIINPLTLMYFEKFLRGVKAI